MGIETAKRLFKRTGFQSANEISPWQVHFTGHVNSDFLLCDNHSSYLDEYFSDNLEPEDIRDTLRSETYLVDRTFL